MARKLKAPKMAAKAMEPVEAEPVGADPVAAAVAPPVPGAVCCVSSLYGGGEYESTDAFCTAMVERNGGAPTLTLDGETWRDEHGRPVLVVLGG